MTLFEFIGVVAIAYAIAITVLFFMLRASFNKFIQVQAKLDRERSEGIEVFLKETQWLIDHTESEEVDKSVEKLKKIMLERVL